MSAPRHLWSGDWQLESSSHADELAANRARTAVPDTERPVTPPRRQTPTLRERMRVLLARMRALLRRMRARLARMRNLPVGNRHQRRIAIAAVALTLLLASGAYAVTSTVMGGGSGGPTSSASGSGAWLGIDVASSPLGGVMVVDVFPGSPAQAAGMEPGDVVTQINGNPVYSPSDVTSAIASMRPGDHVQLQFEGSGTTYSASVPLASRPAGYP